VAASQGFADQILAQTQAIKPSLYVRQGASASIVLRSDLDFSDAYDRKR
jgi:type IV secretory pathway VirB10-like protein